MSDKFVGVGKNGEPITAWQAFWVVIDEAQAEWDMQANLSDEESERLGAIYLMARLQGKLATLLDIARDLQRTT